MTFFLQPQTPYELIDSGNGRKLERYGQAILIRPSSLCIWKPLLSEKVWRSAQAEYLSSGSWKMGSTELAEWPFPIGNGLEMVLRLQRNGQVGIFPEHISYLAEISAAISALRHKLQRKPRLLNLFAYTGMATLVSTAEEAEVTHVDISKAALAWTKVNLAKSQLPGDAVRLICEDAVTFLRKEVRRENKYDLIIADPPNFSRIDKKNSWEIEAILPAFITDLCALLAKEAGALFMTAHQLYGGKQVITNLLQVCLRGGGVKPLISSRDLELPEAGSERTLPAGTLVQLSYGI